MLKTEASIEEIARQTAEFLSREIKLERLILYGSYAYGAPRQDSDFDIAVISEDFQDMPLLEKMKLFSEAALEVDSRLELKGFTLSEFLNPEQGSLLELIKAKGRALNSALYTPGV